MSNPAVISLAKSKTKMGPVKVEANLGEPFHLHIGDIRLDLGKEEMRSLVEQCDKLIDAFLPKELKKFLEMDDLLAKWLIETGNYKNVSIRNRCKKRVYIYVIEEVCLLRRLKIFKISKRKISDISTYLNPIFSDISPVYFQLFGSQKLPKTHLLIRSEFGICLNGTINQVERNFETITLELGVLANFKILVLFQKKVIRNLAKSILQSIKSRVI